MQRVRGEQWRWQDEDARGAEGEQGAVAVASREGGDLRGRRAEGAATSRAGDDELWPRRALRAAATAEFRPRRAQRAVATSASGV